MAINRAQTIIFFIAASYVDTRCDELRSSAMHRQHEKSMMSPCKATVTKAVKYYKYQYDSLMTCLFDGERYRYVHLPQTLCNGYSIVRLFFENINRHITDGPFEPDANGKSSWIQLQIAKRQTSVRNCIQIAYFNVKS